jgi:hypothetical protein
MADITERSIGRPLITANKNGGTDCYGSFAFAQPFEESEQIGWQSYRDSTGAYRTRVSCPIYRDNRPVVK